MPRSSGRSPLTSLACAGLLALATACGSEDTPGGETGTGVPDPDGSGSSPGGKADGTADWETVGYGATHRDMPGATGAGIAVVYGGYGAKLGWVQTWAKELYVRRLAEAGVRHVYAVQGPKDAAYSSAEIGNTGLAKHLVPRVEPGAPIVVIAHSSGTFPAHELFAHLFEHGLDPDQVTRKRIVYYHLEGGTLGLDAGIVSELAHAYFVSARDQTVDTLAANYWVSQDLGKKYASSGGSSIVVDVPDSGCASGGRWCLHDAVVNTRPHKPNAYDLERDYQIFEPAPRALQTDFIDATLPW